VEKRFDPKPDDAWWDPEAQEFAHGAKDDRGRLTGEVRYWNAAGVLISTADHVAGKPHGIARRYYPNGEVSQDSRYVEGVIDGVRRFFRPSDPSIPADGLLARFTAVATYHCVYEHGDLIGMQYFDRDGRELSEHQRPMKKRPTGVPPTAWHLEGQGWFWSRRRGEAGDETIEAREYFDNGKLREVSDHRTGSELAYYRNGKLRHQGQRRSVGQRYPQVGRWETFDAKGQLRLVSRYSDDGIEVARIWHRTAREAKGGGVTREGAVERGLEVGVWIVRDSTGAVSDEWDLGPYLDDAQLLAHVVTADELDDADHQATTDRSLVATLARVRRAGRTRMPYEFRLASTPAWKALDDTGKQVSLAHRAGLVALLHALRCGPPDGELLARIAAVLFTADRATAALDVLDAAQLVGDDPAWRANRASYLRALGRLDEADRLLAGPDRLDDRALSLLAEIRANPADDAPRLVLADQLASAFPEHAALIVAQCSQRDDPALVRAFLATLPSWVREYPLANLTRGFYEDLRYMTAEQFVTGEPDQFYRVAPTCPSLELQYASGHIATLVTMPALRRYRDLSFHDTYLRAAQCTQLAGCEYLEQLEHLGLYSTGLDDDALVTLARSTAFPRLQSLDLTNGRSDQNYGLAGVAALADAVFAPHLLVLRMGRRWLGNDIVEIIARLPALIELDLSGGDLSDDGAFALAALPHHFTSLALGNNTFTDAGKRALVDRFGEGVSFAY
jgi:uncharacterized protein (TIGR02996 family)